MNVQRGWSARPIMPLVLVLALAAALIGVVPAHAATAVKSNIATKSTAGFRAQLLTFFEQVERVGRENPAFNKHDTNLIALGNQGRKAVQRLSPAQLAFLQQRFSPIRGWRQFPGILAEVAHGPYKSGERVPHDILGTASCVENGTTYPDPGLAAVIAASDAALASQIVWEATPDSALEGAPDPARVAAVAAYAVLQGTATGLQNAHDLYEECSADQQSTLIQSISDNLATDTSNIRSDIGALKSDLDTGVTNIRNDIATFKNDVDARLTTVANKITGVQTTLDQSVEQRQIHLQVVTPPGGHIVLVSTTEGGQPIEATLVSIKVAPPTTPLSFTDMTSQVAAASAGVPGVMKITFAGTNATNTVFQIEVKETSTIDGQSVTHYGTILVNQQSS